MNFTFPRSWHAMGASTMAAPEYHCHVGVVSAGVHHPRRFGGPLHSGLLGHRQGVHVRPYGYGGPLSRPAPKQAHHPSACCPRHLEAKASERLLDDLAGAVLVEGRLRSAMEQAADPK